MLEIVDTTGTPITGSPNKNLATAISHHIHLKKYGNRYFEIFANGDLLVTIPYLRAEVVGSSYGKFIQFGVFDPTKQADFELFYLQYAINTPFSTPRYLSRLIRSYKPFIKINELLKAISRAVLRETQRAKEKIANLVLLLQSDAVTIQEAKLSGDLLPQTATPTWTKSGQAITTIDISEILIQKISTTNAKFTLFIEANAYFDILFEFDLTIPRDWILPVLPQTPSLGPQILIDDGTKQIILSFSQKTTGEITVGFSNGALLDVNFAYLSRFFVLDPSKRHHFKIFKSANREIWIWIDGRIVDSINYAKLADSSGGARIEWGTDQNTAEGNSRWRNITLNISIDGVPAEVCENAPFIPFLQKNSLIRLLQDRLLFPSFQETNSELVHLIGTSEGTLSNRGTDLFLIELCRIAGGDCFLIIVERPTEWILEENDYLERIWLDGTQQLIETIVEFELLNTAYSPEDLKTIILDYLAPAGYYANDYLPAEIFKIVSIDTTNLSYDTIILKSTLDLLVNDIVTVRKSDNSISEITTITAIPNIETIRVSKLTQSYAQNDYIRLLL